ncbi:TM2 domain-containing protein [Weissella viridescens]|uniref:TM2 domain-containing protein n=1 Tax=Weissella viridescens TaxID=1629 RepID=UPI0017460FDA|nr:TM2 domain-containing protein [Weissella viridescens]QOD86260.1 TM2 domain-containing protein [Weissella viridescens]WJI91388.1 TM2 domain-containing protein [Weissella viridescens]
MKGLKVTLMHFRNYELKINPLHDQDDQFQYRMWLLLLSMAITVGIQTYDIPRFVGPAVMNVVSNLGSITYVSFLFSNATFFYMYESEKSERLKLPIIYFMRGGITLVLVKILEYYYLYLSKDCITAFFTIFFWEKYADIQLFLKLSTVPPRIITKTLAAVGAVYLQIGCSFVLALILWNILSPKFHGKQSINDGENTSEGALNHQNSTKFMKSKLVAGFLGIFMGGLGLQKFYLGKYKRGGIQLVSEFVGLFFNVGWIIALWGFVEGILILFSTNGSKWHLDANGDELRG